MFYIVVLLTTTTENFSTLLSLYLCKTVIKIFGVTCLTYVSLIPKRRRLKLNWKFNYILLHRRFYCYSLILRIVNVLFINDVL